MIQLLIAAWFAFIECSVTLLVVCRVSCQVMMLMMMLPHGRTSILLYTILTITMALQH